MGPCPIWVRPFCFYGVMPVVVRVSAKCDIDALRRELFKNAQGWAKTMEYATKDMRRAGNTIIARNTAGIYNIKRPKVNANSRQFKGGCSLTGGLANMTWSYEGEMQTPVDFGMDPTGRQRGRYTTTATVLKGRPVKVGHGGPPWSEGGRHSRRNSSPAFFIPGIRPPMYRDPTGKFTPVKVISTPQMVTSERHIDQTLDQLQQRHMEIVERRLRTLGLT